MSSLYLGLMSGTSMDGIDAVLVEFGRASLEIRHTAHFEYPEALQARLQDAIGLPLDQDIPDLARLHREVGERFRDAANALLAAAGVRPAAVAAIGSHGQTLRHQPQADPPFSLQVGDPELIADGTGIVTVADFRRADIDAGGQGAPLAPFFHQWLFQQPGIARAVLNIGGIANVTLLADGQPVTGFDTGPGNTLMDAWIRKHRGTAYDRDGRWAGSAPIDDDLLARLLADPYFSMPPPKSTGFEYFNLRWLDAADPRALDPAVVQATLCALTARSIADAIETHAPGTGEVLVCGGGVHNTTLMAELDAVLGGSAVRSTATAGLDPDWVEAAAFAWLAMRRLQERPGNLPSVTGARHPVLLGTVHAPAKPGST